MRVGASWGGCGVVCFGCCRWYPSVFTGEVGSSCQLSCCVLGGLLVLSIRVGGTPGVLWVLTKVLCVVSGGGGVPAALVFAWSCVSLLSCMLFLGSWCCFLGRRVELMAMDVRGPLDSCVVRCDSVDSFPFGASGLRGCGVSASILSLRLPWGEVEVLYCVLFGTLLLVCLYLLYCSAKLPALPAGEVDGFVVALLQVFV